MSAFAGLLRYDGRPVERHELERLARALPKFDDGPVTVWSDGPVGLTHRLYAITPEDRMERQPWVGGDRAFRLVFAGRLDNREPLAAELGISPAQLRESADGALCLMAIERWGDDAPTRLFGGFAFACCDTRERRLLLCRDPMGRRSLYFHRAGNFIAFATTMNTLLALPDVPRELNETIVGDLLVNNPFEQRLTIYRGIERIAGGELALCDRTRTTTRRYWQPRRLQLGLKSHADCVEAAREQLERAVACAMRSARPVAATSSGGLDSSGVAATAARLLAPARLAVFTRLPPPAFDWPETETKYFNERAKVEALARMHPNMNVTFVDDAGLHAFDEVPMRIFASFGMPMLAVHNLGWFFQLYDRVKTAGHRVLLSGQSGNFSLGWNGRNRLDQLVRKGSWGRAAKEALAMHRVTGQPIRGILREYILNPRKPAWWREFRQRRHGLGAGQSAIAFVAPDFAREHRLMQRIEKISGQRHDVLWGDPFDMRVHWLINQRGILSDFAAQMPAIAGFELCDPLSDPGLIEFCLNVPEEHYLRNGRPRALQRDVIADRVPPDIGENYKHGDQTPEWFDRMTKRRDGILADIESIGRSPLASRAIDVDGLRKAAQNWPGDAQAARRADPKFRYGLARAVHLGNFIRWFEGGNQ